MSALVDCQGESFSGGVGSEMAVPADPAAAGRSVYGESPPNCLGTGVCVRRSVLVFQDEGESDPEHHQPYPVEG
jgi:hypothetical protein